MAERKILLDSTLDSVEVAETEVLGAAREIGFHEDDLHQLGMAVRESMVNAVVHGNRYNARKKVHLSVTKEADRLTIVIADEGDGFDPNSVPDPLAEAESAPPIRPGIAFDSRLRRRVPSASWAAEGDGSADGEVPGQGQLNKS